MLEIESERTTDILRGFQSVNLDVLPVPASAKTPDADVVDGKLETTIEALRQSAPAEEDRGKPWAIRIHSHTDFDPIEHGLFRLSKKDPNLADDLEKNGGMTVILLNGPYPVDRKSSIVKNVRLVSLTRQQLTLTMHPAPNS